MDAIERMKKLAETLLPFASGKYLAK